MNRAVEAVEAALQRPVVLVGGILRIRNLGHMPLACHVGRVAGCFQRFGDGDGVLAQFARVGRADFRAVIVHHVADTRLMRVKAGQQSRTRRAAAGGVVELREAHAALRQRVDVRRVDLAAIATHVGVAHIIAHDEDDVGPRCCRE